MESIIKDLLFLAEVGESREPAHNPVNLDLIIKGHIEVIQALNPQRTVEYLSIEDSVIYSDQALMDRMIGNLFSNIRRHTPEGAPVRVALDRSKDSLTLVVEDGGAGFENFPDKTRLSKRFSPERSADGTGLGLSIISSIVDRYEGTLSYSRSSLGGVRVEIVLPLSEPESSG